MMKSLFAVISAALMLAVPNISLSNESSADTAGQPAGAASKPDFSGDPLQLVISLDDQRLRAYRGGGIVVDSRVSSGKRGYDTPTGIFSILHKKKFHRSNIYSGAPMPYMQRLTWTGIALHGSGSVPSYAASHGCVRLPRGFDAELYSMTRSGGHVLITKQFVEPRQVSHATLPQPAVQSRYDAAADHWLTAYRASGQFEADPARQVSTAGLLKPVRDAIAMPLVTRDDSQPVRILITRRSQSEVLADVQRLLNRLGYDAGEVDGRFGPATSGAIKRFQEDNEMPANGGLTRDFVSSLYVIAGIEQPQNAKLAIRYKFEELLETGITIENPERPLGTHLLLTSQFDRENATTDWLAYTLNNRINAGSRAFYGIDSEASDQVTLSDALDRIKFPTKVSRLIAGMLTPGSSIMIADNGTERYTGWKTDFTVETKDFLPKLNQNVGTAGGGKRADSQAVPPNG